MAGSALRYQLYWVCIWPCVTSYSWAILCIREPAIPATFWAAREPVIPGIISGFQNQVYVLMDAWFLPDTAGYLRRFVPPSLIRTVFIRKPLLVDRFHDACGTMPGGNILAFYCTMTFPVVFLLSFLISRYSLLFPVFFHIFLVFLLFSCIFPLFHAIPALFLTSFPVFPVHLASYIFISSCFPSWMGGWWYPWLLWEVMVFPTPMLGDM